MGDSGSRMQALPGPRIHITGASGAGTTTLGAALATKLGVPHFDSDDYFWLPTKIPYEQEREAALRNELLLRDLTAHASWVHSGSLDGWESGAEQQFTLAVLVYVPQELRLARLAEREREELGDIIAPGGSRHADYREFMDWAARYDTAGLEQRSLVRHNAWLAELGCLVLRIEGDTTTAERIRRVLAALTPAAAHES